MATVRAEPQNPEGIAAFLAELPDVLLEVGAPSSWHGQYGYGCCIHPDLWYKSMAIKLSRLAAFLSESIEQAIFLPGYSSLELTADDGRLSIEISHEGFARISGTDPMLAEAIARHPAVARTLVRVIAPKA